MMDNTTRVVCKCLALLILVLVCSPMTFFGSEVAETAVHVTTHGTRLKNSVKDSGAQTITVSVIEPDEISGGESDEDGERDIGDALVIIAGTILAGAAILHTLRILILTP